MFILHFTKNSMHFVISFFAFKFLCVTMCCSSRRRILEAQRAAERAAKEAEEEVIGCTYIYPHPYLHIFLLFNNMNCVNTDNNQKSQCISIFYYLHSITPHPRTQTILLEASAYQRKQGPNQICQDSQGQS